MWNEGTCLTVTHGELHGEHITLHKDRSYVLDRATAHYGAFYLDLGTFLPPKGVDGYADIPRMLSGQR